ncbi:MAG: isoprenylcysteine carboxylmethyltransferase family protein [Pseudomonadota bacterium]
MKKLSLLQWIDIPPVWLMGALAITYVWPFDVSLGAWSHGLGTAIIVVAALLIVAALFEFQRHKTTPVPHMEADRLITSGIFALTRNPIYLADLLLLAGFSLRWGAPIGFLLLPLLYDVLTRRFIRPEEDRLSVSFGMQFKQYQAKTRRWI